MNVAHRLPIPHHADTAIGVVMGGGEQELGALCERLRFTTGAEVGVQGDGFGAHMLSSWTSCAQYTLIANWPRDLRTAHKPGTLPISCQLQGPGCLGLSGQFISHVSEAQQTCGC